MPWRLRQVAVLAADRQGAIRLLTDTFGLEVCHQADTIDDFAMSNAVVVIGDQFLEVATPLDDSSPAGRLLAKRGEGGYLVMLQTEDLDTARRQAEGAGAVVTIELEHADARELHFHPRTTAGVALALDWMDPPTSWRWAGSDWERAVRTDVVSGVAGLTISADEPDIAAARWGEVLGCLVETGPDGSMIWLDSGDWLRFTRRRGASPAVTRIHLTPVESGQPISVHIGDCEITTLPTMWSP